MLCDELESEKTCKASQKEIGTRNIFRNSSDEKKKKKIVQKRKLVSRDSYNTKKKNHTAFFPGSKCGGRVITTESCVYAFLSFSLKKICALRAL